MNAPSPASRVLCCFMAAAGAMLAALPLTAQVSHTYTAPPPPGYPASGALRQPASTKATRQSAAAVQTPATYPGYPSTYPPPPGYTYPPPPPGYGPPPRPAGSKTAASTKTPAKTSSKAGTASSKKSAAPPPPPKVYGPTGDLTSQVTKIANNDKVQNMRLGELERDVSSIKRGGKGSAPRYDGGTDIAPYTSYVARPGDTLFRIASTHRVSVGEIQQLNRMTEEEVHVGQTLLIPSPHRTGAPTTQVSYRPATPGGGSAAPPAAPQGGSSASSSSYYTVKKGDSLKAIALKHKMTTAALASANRIKDANKIFVGQRLSIPGRTVVAPKPTSRPAQPRPDAGDTVPLPGFGTGGDPAPAAGLGLGLTPAPAPPSPAPPPSSGAAAGYHDTHRGILAYRVDRSDTVESIAHQFSTTPERIREMNRLQAGASLKSGDEIMVPAMGAVSVGR